MPAYSLLCTSCQRDDLLKDTIESYLESCDQQPREMVFVDDGPDRPMPEFLQKYRHLGLKWICNGRRSGQILSCDRLWRECSNEYAMWMEEDWHFDFNGQPFVRQSFDILQKYPEVILVSLRGDSGWHPLIRDPRFPFPIAEPNWRGGWGGFSFNPGLRRKSDYTRIRSYGSVTGYGTSGLGHEIKLSQVYAGKGFVIADQGKRFASHTGDGRSRAREPLLPPKVLVAIKAGHSLHYSQWESSESPKFDRATAYKGQAYGTNIHISEDSNPRIQAIRDTWWQDVKNHPTLTAKFFYGTPAPRSPLPDEVFLKTPDDYANLHLKTIAICRWATEHDFDYAFLCDDDTGVYVDRLVQDSYRVGDYAGYINGEMCSGGTGYWLSRRALALVQDNPIGWTEDGWVGRCMKFAGISPEYLEGYLPGFTDHWFFKHGFDPSKLNDSIVTMHALRPEDLRAWYAHCHPVT